MRRILFRNRLISLNNAHAYCTAVIGLILFFYIVCLNEMVRRTAVIKSLPPPPTTSPPLPPPPSSPPPPPPPSSPTPRTIVYHTSELTEKPGPVLFEFSHLDILLGELDSSSKYKIHPFFIVGSFWRDLSRQKLSIATQSSIEHLHWLVDTLSTWTGPMSVAVFTPDIEYHLCVIYISFLRECTEAIKNQVSFHFVYPIEKPPKIINELTVRVNDIYTFNCSVDPKEFLKENLLIYRTEDMMKKWRNELLYPQNVLRNLARRTCNTEYVLCADIDMIPTSTQMKYDLEVFLNNTVKRNECNKCAYVVPVYEISTSATSVPYNKSELLKLVKSKKARPFHKVVFSKNQLLSNLPEWEKLNSLDEMKAAYTSRQYDFFYEPIYISDKNVPQYDERFLGYGNTRNTQIYEMFLSGWRFLILNNAFLVHWGFQNISTYTPWRKKQIIANKALFTDFVREMAVKYDRDPIRLLKRFPKNDTYIIVEPKYAEKYKREMPVNELKRNVLKS